MSNMFDFLDDPDKKNKSTSAIAPVVKSGSGNMFDFLDEAAPTAQPQAQFQMRSSHTSYQAPQSEPSTLQKLGKGLTESALGSIGYKLGAALKNGDFRTPTPFLPDYQPKTLGDKALNLIGSTAGDAGLWMSGDALLAKPLAALAKTAPIAKGLSLLPKAITPALGAGVKAGATYGGLIAPVETAIHGDGLQGLLEREKQVPLMALGGTALHGAGQLVGSGIKSGVDYAKFNKLTQLPELKSNSLEDIQNAFKSPTLRDAKAQQLSNTFADSTNNLGRTGPTLQRQGMTPAELLQQKQADARSVFGGPREMTTFKDGEHGVFVGNWDSPRTESLPKASAEPANNLTSPFERVAPEKPSPLTWTNRDGIQSAGPLPIRSITQDNLGQLPRRQAKVTGNHLVPEYMQGTRGDVGDVPRIEPQQPTTAEAPAKRQKIGQEATDFVREQNLLENSDKWKDKRPLSLQTETWGRNIIDIAGKKDGEKIKAAIFDPIHTNEADFMRFKNAERSKIAALKLSGKESAIVQQVGEGKLDIREIPAGMNADKIMNAVTAFRNFYDKAIDMANEALTRNNYKPVGKLENYFPHFEGEDPLMKALGIKINLVDLPTDINGLSHQFRPGKNWVGNFLHRTGDQTTFDAVQGFDRYLESAGKVIFHTDDVQRLRAFEREIRMKYSPEEIKGKVQALIDNKTISKEAKDVAIEDLLGRDSTHLSNSVSDLQEFTNVLAGKKDLVDRAEERRFSRPIYNIAAGIENRIGKNMVAINPGTWLTQFIPMTQSLATTNKVAVAQAMKDTMRNIFKNDGFVNRSTFLTNRVGSDPLSKGITERVGDTLSAPMRWVDQFSSQVVTRSKYLEGIKQGMSPEQAMIKADDWAAKLLGDRSAGAQPTIFTQLNPITKLFTQFQLESKNQLSFLFKDMPSEFLKDGKTNKNIARLTSAVTQLMVYSWMYNQVFEKLTGRRPALDPIGIAANLEKDLNNPNLTSSRAIENLGGNIGQQIPFLGGIFLNGGRVPISSALSPLTNLKSDLTKMGTDEKGPKEGATDALKHLGTTAAYIVPPFGGGQIKKGLDAYSQLKAGGKFNGNQLEYPVAKTPSNIAKGYMFGPSSFPETRDYYDNARTPLTDKQTREVLKSKNVGSSYDAMQYTRKADSLKQKIDYIKKDKSLSKDDKEERINKLQDLLIKLRSMQK